MTRENEGLSRYYRIKLSDSELKNLQSFEDFGKPLIFTSILYIVYNHITKFRRLAKFLYKCVHLQKVGY